MPWFLWLDMAGKMLDIYCRICGDGFFWWLEVYFGPLSLASLTWGFSPRFLVAELPLLIGQLKLHVHVSSWLTPTLKWLNRSVFMVLIAHSDFQHSTTLRECGHRPSATYRRLRQVGLNAFRGVPPGGCYLQTLSDGWNMLEPSAGGMSKPTVLKCTKD